MSPLARRILIAALLLVAFGAAVQVARLPQSADQPSSEIVKSITPGPNEKIVQQGQIRIQLLSGWAGQLTIDQRPIPDPQINRNQDPTLATHQQLLFQPGPGKALEYFPPGQNCASLTYWQLKTGPSQSFVKNWCFTAF
jgi:hypothetical protein